MAKMTSRRTFLRSAPVAAAVGFTFTDALFAAAQAAAGPGSDVNAAATPFQYFSAKTLDADAKALQAKPGNNNLFDSKTLPLQIVLTTETHKNGAEFEWHEGRDHIIQIVEGM